MIFRVAKALFTSAEIRVVDILALLRAAAHRGHTLWAVAAPVGTDEDDPAAWRDLAKGMSEPLRTEIGWLHETLSPLSAHAVTRGSVVVAVDASEPAAVAGYDGLRVDLKRAVRLAGLPLFVLVENVRSDAAFLFRAMPPAWRAQFESWQAAGVIRFDHGGGVSVMTTLVKTLATPVAPVGGVAAHLDPLGLGPDAWRAVHFLCSDRDAEPGREYGDQTQKLVRACAGARMGDRLHVLRRRDQEGYLPLEALHAYVLAKETSPSNRTDMFNKLQAHFGDKARHSKELPRLGKNPYFKNVFVEPDLGWQDDWFERDGAWPEMVEIAEMVAAFT